MKISDQGFTKARTNFLDQGAIKSSTNFAQDIKASRTMPPTLPSHVAQVNYAYNTTKVIESSRKASADISRYLLRLYYYLRVKVKLSPRIIAELVCLDTRYSVTLVDRVFLKAQLPHQKIHRKDLPLIIRGIELNHYSTAEYIKLNIYLPGRHDSDR